MTGFLIVIGSIIGGILAGFFIPFIIAQFDNNPAWSFVTFYTIPIGLVVGLIVGLYLALK